MKTTALVLSALLASAFGFSGNTADDTRPAPRPPVTDYKIDSVHSSAIFRVLHAGAAPFYGRFDKVEGTVSLDPEKLDATKFEVTIAADSVWTGNENRDKHLRGPDFFDVKQFPTVTFKGTGAKKVEKDVYELKGTLSMHGVEKPVTARPANASAPEIAKAIAILQDGKAAEYVHVPVRIQ